MAPQEIIDDFNKKLQRHLNSLKDPKEREMLISYFENLEKIRKKYDPYRSTCSKGLDGGFPEENKELLEEHKRYLREWKAHKSKYGQL